jgi:serine/threonine protein kinase
VDDAVYCGGCGERVSRDVAACPACGADPRLAGRYRLDAILGRGAGGTTWRALDLRSATAVAIKEVALGPGADAAARERLEREARVLSQLAHPAIPRYVEHFTAGVGKHRALYLVQALVEGQTLAAELERRRYTEDDVLSIVAELLGVLGYLHALRPPVVHRDVKPRNVMRRPDGGLALVDFGAVRDVLRDPALGGSTIAGTYGYMAPEQFRGEASPAADVYALAVLAVVLLSRRAPEDMTNGRHELDWRPWVHASPPLVALLGRWLDPDPARRPADALAARADLERMRTAPPPAPETPTLPVVVAEGPERLRIVAVLLAFLFGFMGGEHWYLGNRAAGLFSLLFCWTGLPFLFNLAHGIQLLGMSPDDFDRRYNPQRWTLRQAGGGDFTRQLADLHALRERGALTAEEYEVEKARLLAARERLLPAPRRRRKRRR